MSLPALGNTEDSVAEYLQAVVRAVEHGQVDARVGDTLIKAAQGVLTSLRQQADRGLRARVARIEQWLEMTEREGIERVVRDRQRLTDD